MKYVFSCEFFFEVNADNYEKAIEKGWDFIYSNMPKCFDTDGAELVCIESEEDDE